VLMISQKVNVPAKTFQGLNFNGCPKGNLSPYPGPMANLNRAGHSPKPVSILGVGLLKIKYQNLARQRNSESKMDNH
ncbi:MAG: hypothetical protein V2B13_04360, partial [Pseudomonadota bacterium]